MQQRDATRQVIEHQQRRRRDERGVRDAGLRRRVLRQALEQPDDIVARHTDQPAGKRQVVVGHRSRSELERLSQRIEVLMLVLRARARLAVDGKRCRVHAHLHRIAEAEKRIPGQALATLDALQQEAWPHRFQLQKSRDRGVQVGGYVKRCLHALFLYSGTVTLIGDRPTRSRCL